MCFWQFFVGMAHSPSLTSLSLAQEVLAALSAISLVPNFHTLKHYDYTSIYSCVMLLDAI